MRRQLTGVPDEFLVKLAASTAAHAFESPETAEIIHTLADRLVAAEDELARVLGVEPARAVRHLAGLPRH